MKARDLPEVAELVRSVLESRSSFYRRKYDGAPAVRDFLSGTGHFEDLPFLTRDDIERAPFFDRLFIERDEVDAVRVTTGTSGRKVVVVPRLAYEDSPDLPPHHSYFAEKGIRRLATFSGSHFFSSLNYRRKYNIASIQLDPSLPRLASSFVRAFEPDMLSGFSYALCSLAPLLPDTSAKKIRAILLVGELSSALQQGYLRERFPNAVLCTEYASIEAQTSVAEPCGQILSTGELAVHPIPGYAHLEILGEQGKRLVDEGEIGEITITILRPVGFPLIRYKTGDLGRIISNKCPCGIPTPTISIEGRRAADRVRVAGGELNTSEIGRVLGTLREYVTGSGFRARVAEIPGEKHGAPRAQLSISLQFNTEKIRGEDLAALIESELRIAPGRVYASCVAAGTLAPLVVKFQSDDALRAEKSAGIIRNDQSETMGGTMRQ